MWDCDRRGRRLVGRPRRLWRIFAETCSSDRANTSSVRRFGLEGVSRAFTEMEGGCDPPELTDFWRYPMACSWLLQLVLCW